MGTTRVWIGVVWLAAALGAAGGPGLQAWQDKGGMSKEQREKLERQARELNEQVGRLFAEARIAEAIPVAEKALAIREQLYPPKDYPDGHPALALSLGNLGGLLVVRREPHKALPYLERSLAMYRRLYPEGRYKDGHNDLANALNSVGGALYVMGEPARALPYVEEATRMRLRLYGSRKDGHPELAFSMNNLANLLLGIGELARALPYSEQAVAMYQRLYGDRPDGHPDLAMSLSTLGFVVHASGEPGKALPYFERSLAMYRRLYPEGRFKKGHPALAKALNDLGVVLMATGQPAQALNYFEKVLAMYQQLYLGDGLQADFPDLAMTLNNVGGALNALGQPAKALPYLNKALAMYQRLYPEERFKNGHSDVATTRNNVASVLIATGEPAKALPHYEKALAMYQRLYPKERFKDGHPLLVMGLTNRGTALREMGEPGRALPHYEKALAMHRRLTDREVAFAPEASALGVLASAPPTRDGYLSIAVGRSDSRSAYEHIWDSRSALLRLVLRRHEAAAVARLQSDTARAGWQQLGDVRRQIGRLLLHPGKDLKERDRLLEGLERQQERIERDLLKLLPALDEHRQLAKLGPKDLAARLPQGVAFIDLVHHAHYGKGGFTGERYLAFVLARGPRVECVELGDAAAIDKAIASWRGSIARREPSTAPARLRNLVWDKLEKHLPKDTTTVYLSVDGELSRLPFAALPGRKHDTVLLEDYSLAVVPNGLWLLQQLRKPAPKPRAKESLFAVGDVAFGKGGKGYDPLPESGRELKRVLEAFAAPADAGLRADRATASTLLQRLPKATVAHLATHGYFDQKALADEHRRAREMAKRWTFTETGTPQAGLGARNPLGFVGLALAGANDPSKADRGGIVTGLDLLELPLGNLRLCVLSACETGLGQWSEHGGVAGLPGAFHIAGCRNVVSSLWNVNDAATAALMTQFYHELRVNKRTPLAALREAQLTIYRHPERIPELAGDRGRPALEKAAKLGSAPPKAAVKGKKADTRLWAAFVLSGVGD